MKPSIGARSDVGRVRDGNEDSYLIQDPVYVVADGMGGHLAGDVASRIAVQTISERTQDGNATTPDALERAVKAANEAIWSKAKDDPSLHGMGTTCTLVLVADAKVHLAHVGDSRAYLFRDGELTQITDDHTLVGRMVKEGRLKPEEAERHPQRNIVTRALGVDEDVQVDLETVPVQEGDTILICSDGLSSMVGADAIREVLARASDPQQAADGLIDIANEAGGEDNITALVLVFHGGNSSGHAAPAEEITRAVPRAEVARRTESVQPGASPEEVTGAFDVPKPSRAERTGRRARPILTSVLIVLLVLIAGAVAFKFLIVNNSYYVTATDDGRIAIYQGLPDEVLGLTFQEQLEVSETRAEDLPTFLMEDVQDAIETDSLSDARETLSNLEERAQDEEFQRARDKKSGDNS